MYNNENILLFIKYFFNDDYKRIQEMNKYLMTNKLSLRKPNTIFVEFTSLINNNGKNLYIPLDKYLNFIRNLKLMNLYY